MFLRFLIKSAEKFFREAPFDGSGNIFWEVHNTLSRKISTPYKKLSVPLFIPYLKYQLMIIILNYSLHTHCDVIVRGGGGGGGVFGGGGGGGGGGGLLWRES